MNEIQTVKKQSSGYLLNGTMSVPKADGNKEYELIKQWISEGNTPKPEFTDEELLKQKQDKFRAERTLLLDKADIEINKAEDLEQDSKVLRVYRQKLRDSTINWVMPESVI